MKFRGLQDASSDRSSLRPFHLVTSIFYFEVEMLYGSCNGFLYPVEVFFGKEDVDARLLGITTLAKGSEIFFRKIHPLFLVSSEEPN